MRFLLAFFLVACGAAPAPGPDPNKTSADPDGGGVVVQPNEDGAVTAPTLSSDVQPVFDKVCTRCHATRIPVLTAAKSRIALDGTSACMSGGKKIPYVVPGHPEESFLFYKIGGETTFEVTGTCAQTMPSDGPSLAQKDPAAVELVREWILNGAQ